MEKFEKEYYRRNLPHWQPRDGIFNICFRLANTLPIEKWLTLKEHRKNRIIELDHQAPYLSRTALNNLLKDEEDLYFGKFDELLDQQENGPKFLEDSEIAEIVSACLHYWEKEKRYRLICYCIMPNHVHLMIKDIQKPLYRILQTIKSYTSKLANEKLNRSGQAFWQKESYDNLIRNEDDMASKIQYIINNPVKAKLVNDWKRWEHTYMNPAFEECIEQLYS
jgi:REP element-mobilizing transposase RayT